MSAGPSRITPGCAARRRALHAFVLAHYAETGVIDFADLACDFGTVLGAVIQKMEDEPARSRAVRFARDCIDAGFEAARTGAIVTLDSDASREH